MPDHITDSLLNRSKLNTVTDEDRRLSGDYLEAVRAFARLSYESVYVIDYTRMGFEYVSDNPLFLCGHSAEEVLQLGYEFYFKHVPAADLQLLALINEAGFDFFERQPEGERKQFSISYDFHLVQPDGKPLLISHKLTPLVLTAAGKMWKSLCIVSLSQQQESGNVMIQRQGSADCWILDIARKVWQKEQKPQLSERDTEVLRLYAQGLSISQIAARLFVAPDTVKYYRRRIFEQLGVNNITAALAVAVRWRVV